jgi:hypothetical protein
VTRAPDDRRRKNESLGSDALERKDEHLSCLIEGGGRMTPEVCPEGSDCSDITSPRGRRRGSVSGVEVGRPRL